jgi:hypothetical protein
MWYAQIIGYIFAVVIGGILTKLVSDRMWKCIGWDEKNDDSQKLRPNVWQPRVIGIVERILYVATLQLGKAEFVGIWLALKVAGQWSRWSKDPEEGENLPQGRTIYHNFLIGNGISVLYAFVGFKVIEWLSSGKILQATLIPIALVVFTLILWGWLKRRLSQSPAA